MKLNMYELAHHFWRTAEEQPFTPSETALYFLLLQRANLVRWEMPVKCPNVLAVMLMGTTKQNVTKARTGLIERGLISYSRSETRGRCGLYTLLPLGQSQLPDKLPSQLPTRLPRELPVYKNKDKEQNSFNHTAREQIKSLDELEAAFSADEDWLRQVVVVLSSPCVKSPDDVRDFLHRFFDTERVKKVETREENDCRQHFIHWLRKQIVKPKTTTNESSKHTDRRGTPATLHGEKDYAAPFMPPR